MEQDWHVMNPWWEGKTFEVGISRPKYVEQLKKTLSLKEVIFLSGLRRIGKTTILKQLISHLLTFVDPSTILYLTLDFLPLREKTLHELVSTFREIHGHSRQKKLYLFLDEITSLPSFEQELKNLYDLENVKVYASSSSASLLKSKNSALVGRSRIIEVFPLDFEEFLLFKKRVVKKDEQYLLKTYAEDFLRLGGLPEYVLTEDASYIKNVVEQIITKDIILLHDIKDKRSVEQLFLLLCERVGKKISYAKLARVLEVSTDSIRRYVEYFKDTFLFFIVEKYAGSLNERTFSPKKVYISDIGIRNVFTGMRDTGALLENLTYLALKHHTVYYYFESGKEIDFIVIRGKQKTAVEVKYKERPDEKELDFFEQSPFQKKILISTVEDIQKLEKEFE